MKPKAAFDPFAIADGDYRAYSMSNRRGKYFRQFDGLHEDGEKGIFNLKSDTISPGLIRLWALLVILVFAALMIRTGYLQLYSGNYYRAMAEGNRLRIKDIKAPRGLIYDRNHNLMVENIPNFSLVVIPVDLPKESSERNRLAEELNKISGKTTEEIKSLLPPDDKPVYSYQPIVIAENLTHEQVIKVEIINQQFPAISYSINNNRHYLTIDQEPSLSHIFGYLGKLPESKKQELLKEGYLMDDYLGKAGLELIYEKELKGQNGKEQVEVEASGKPKEIIATQKAEPGHNLILTVDAELQKIAEASLNEALKKYHKERGVVIVLNPNSGEVLALVSLPAYDNNLFSNGITSEDFNKLINDPNQPMFNRSISGEYPSGSTFKLIVGAAALQEGIADESTSFHSVGGIRIGQWYFPDWKAGGHGTTNITKAVAESVNTYFYMVGGGNDAFKGLGVQKIKEYAEKFGLSKPLGIDLPNEGSGFLPSEEWKKEVRNEPWYIGDTYHLAIGQGDLTVTPLQVAAWTAFFANGGKLYKPYLVKEVTENDSKIVTEIKPEILNQGFIDSKNVELIRKGMRQGVTAGSGRFLGSLPIEAASKTGTAEWNSKKDPHAWVTAFAPFENPQITVTVLIEEGVEGSRSAIPVVYDIMKWWAENR